MNNDEAVPGFFFTLNRHALPLPTMNEAFSIAILVAGVVLLIYGINAHGSIASSAKEVVTGTPTDKSIWLIVLGIVGSVVAMAILAQFHVEVAGGRLGYFVTGFLGACLLIFIARLVRR